MFILDIAALFALAVLTNLAHDLLRLLNELPKKRWKLWAVETIYYLFLLTIYARILYLFVSFLGGLF